VLGGDDGEREVPAPTGTPTHSTRAGESALMAAVTSSLSTGNRIPRPDPGDGPQLVINPITA
jgi:hypothetical protein